MKLLASYTFSWHRGSSARLSRGDRRTRIVVGWMCALGALVPAFMFSNASWASHEEAIEVAQPIATLDGLCISRVTYAHHVGGAEPGRAVLFTAAKNCVLFDGSNQGENRNAAEQYGIGVRLKPDPSIAGRSLAPSDTLRRIEVIVDARKVRKAADFSIDAVIGATIDCVLINAAASRPHVREVHVTVLGDKSMTHFGGDFVLRALKPSAHLGCID
jgi:hypothetical protein